MGRSRSNTHGFASNLPNFMTKLDKIRQGEVPDIKGKKIPRPKSFAEFLAEEFPDVEPGHVYSECGLDPKYTDVETMADDENGKFLMREVMGDAIARGMSIRQAAIGSETGANNFIAPAIYAEPINRGAVDAGYYSNLITREVAVPTPSHIMPYFDLSEIQMEKTNEGEAIRKGRVKGTQKTVKIHKRTRGADITYEAIRYNTIDMLAIYFEQLGRIWARDLNDEVVGVLFNGDESDADESAAAIGVNNTGTGLNYDDDFLYVWLRMSKMGHRPNALIGREDVIAKVLKLTEFKNRQQGTQLVNINLQTPLPTDMDAYINDAAPANHLGFVDTSSAVVQITAMPILMESGRVISKQIEEHVWSVTTGFANVLRYARCWIDLATARSGKDFPVWFNTI